MKVSFRYDPLRTAARRAAMKFARLGSRLAHAAFQAAGAPAVRVMAFHSVHPVDWHPVAVNPANFAAQADILNADAELLSVQDLVDVLGGSRSFPACGAVLTFDDGYADNLDYAAPILVERGIPFCVFVTLDYIDSDVRLPGARLNHYLDRHALRRISAMPGATIGVHGATHCRLKGLDQGRLRAEIIDAGTRLEDLTGRPARFFSFPFGGPSDWDEAALDLVEERYELGFLNWGGPMVAGRNFRRGALPRFHIDHCDGPSEMRELLSGSSDIADLILQKLKGVVGR